MRVEIVFALSDRQVLRCIEVEEGASVAEVIRRSGIERQFPDAGIDGLQAGVWGRPVERAHVLRAGDRVELYRPLEIDPKEARRLKARG